MCVDMGASASTRGLTVWKRIQQVTMACQESAGGILACLSEHVELGVSWSHTLFHSLPFSPYLSEKIPQEGEEKEMWGDKTRDECVELLKRDGMCLCVLLREGQCLVQFSINPALRQSAKGFNRGR